jgi:hypothetical protein
MCTDELLLKYFITEHFNVFLFLFIIARNKVCISILVPLPFVSSFSFLLQATVLPWNVPLVPSLPLQVRFIQEMAFLQPYDSPYQHMIETFTENSSANDIIGIKHANDEVHAFEIRDYILV